MYSRVITLSLLLGVLTLGTGASPEGVQQARDWQSQADVARAGKMWDAAYQYYAQMAETFPGTRYGRLGARRARQMRAQMVTPARSPASEDPGMWLEEIVDFFVWP